MRCIVLVLFSSAQPATFYTLSMAAGDGWCKESSASISSCSSCFCAAPVVVVLVLLVMMMHCCCYHFINTKRWCAGANINCLTICSYFEKVSVSFRSPLGRLVLSPAAAADSEQLLVLIKCFSHANSLVTICWIIRAACDWKRELQKRELCGWMAGAGWWFPGVSFAR